MASSANLYIDPDGVRAAGVGLSGASTAGAASAPAVTPCAADTTSVNIAYALSASISELVNATTALNHRTAQAAARMNHNATTYEDQERANAAGLAGGSRGRPASIPVGDAPALAGPPVLAPPIPAPGVQPTSGKDIASLVHGGPGPEALDTAARALATHASQLDSAAQSVRSARWTSEQNWDSSAAQQASTHLSTLESTYARHADQSRALSQDATVQANNFRQVRANTPPPEHFADLERRLQAAAANTRSGGRYTAAVTKLQTDLAAAHQQAVSSYSTYTAGGQLQAKPLEPGVATTTPKPPGEGEPGSAAGAEDGSPLGAGDVAAQSEPGGNALGDPAGGGGDMLQTLLPTVLGVVAGTAGGLLGAISGAAEKVQQTGTQLVGGLAQGGMSALQGMSAGQPGGSDPSSGDGGSPDLGLGDGGGGSEPGDTQPASAGDGALSAAPASAAAAPAAAPAPTVGTASPAVSGAGAGAGMGAPMGGGMMPPMMGGPGRGGGGDDEKRLYEEKRLRLTTPPNAEPVKGRVEARESRSERRDKQT